MFSKLKNIDTAFRQVRIFSITLLFVCMIVTCYALYKSYSLVSQMQNRIYILAGSKALQAYASDRNVNIMVEARDHIKTFHRLFFTLDPDDKVIQANITKALYLADASAKREYDNLKESGYYTGIIAGNISQRITVDSIWLDLSQYPFYFRYYGTEKITRTTTTVTRSLVTEGYLRTVSRSDNNPHGFLIMRWSTIENKDLKINNR